MRFRIAVMTIGVTLLAAMDANAQTARIAYVEEADVWTMDANGSDRRLIVKHARDPDWSPDGTRIAFSRDGGIATVVAEGGDLRWVVRRHRDTVYGTPRWSPDGARIAFTASPTAIQEEVRTAVEVADVDGANRAVVVERTGRIDDLRLRFLVLNAWTPDGTRLLYSALGFLTGSVRSVSVDGTGDRRVLAEAFGAAISPDGRRLAFVSLKGVDDTPPCEFCLPYGDLAVAGIDGTARRALLRTDGEESSPSWSADGGRILFASTRNVPSGVNFADSELYSMRPDGGCLTWLTNDTRHSDEADWSPSGQAAPDVCGDGGRDPQLADRPGRGAASVPWVGRRFGEALLTDVQGSLMVYDDCAAFLPRDCPQLFLLVSHNACEPSRDVRWQTRHADRFVRVGNRMVARTNDGRGIVYAGRWFIFVEGQSGGSEYALAKRLARRLRTVAGDPLGRPRAAESVRAGLPAAAPRALASC